MSGLILAGIGKGIADAGQTFGSFMMQGIQDKRKDELEALRDERLIAREELREQRAVDRVEAAALKDAEIFAKAEQAAPAIGDTRRFDKFKKDVGPTDMAEDELRKVFDEQYNQRKVGAFEGADRYVERYSKQKEDVLNEIRRTGGSSGLINQAQNSVKTAQEAERAADRLAFDQKKEDARAGETNRRLDLLDERITSQNKTDAIRANKPAGGAGGGAAKVRSTYTNSEGNKVAVMSDGSEKTLGKAGDFDKSVASLVTKMSKDDYAFSKLPEAEKREKAIERLTGGTAAPKTGDNPKPAATISALPKGATQIGTSGGKPVYQTPDGKKFIGN